MSGTNTDVQKWAAARPCPNSATLPHCHLGSLHWVAIVLAIMMLFGRNIGHGCSLFRPCTSCLLRMLQVKPSGRVVWNIFGWTISRGDCASLSSHKACNQTPMLQHQRATSHVLFYELWISWQRVLWMGMLALYMTLLKEVEGEIVSHVIWYRFKGAAYKKWKRMMAGIVHFEQEDTAKTCYNLRFKSRQRQCKVVVTV